MINQRLMVCALLLSPAVSAEVPTPHTYRLIGNGTTAAFFSGTVWHAKGTTKRAGLATVYNAGAENYNGKPVDYSIRDVEIDCTAWTILAVSETVYGPDHQSLNTTIYTAAVAKPLVEGTSLALHAQIVCGRATVSSAAVAQAELTSVGRFALAGTAAKSP